jgi:hypothetical protein
MTGLFGESRSEDWKNERVKREELMVDDRLINQRRVEKLATPKKFAALEKIPRAVCKFGRGEGTSVLRPSSSTSFGDVSRSLTYSASHPVF